ncbi:MAG: hypothetical protein ACRBF0_20570 [Calditrichia bacterium]
MIHYQQKLDKLIKRILNGPGEASVELRQSVAAKAAEYSGQAAASDIPDDLSVWVEKVSLHAYKTTDEDIDQLKAAGYSEDQIFEITLATALGAARSRLHSALRVVDALKEVPHEA